MTVRLWLIRHGSTDWSERGRLTGWTDIPLNASGRNHARRIRELVRGKQFASVWSSDLSRASGTADIAVGGATADARLRELDFGELEGAVWEECSPSIQESLRWFDGFHAPGGESLDHMRSRVLDHIAALGDGDHLVFTHGGVIRLLLRETGLDQHVAPGSVTTITWMPGRSRSGFAWEPTGPRG
jgi:probable phosphoglycerate mutase